MTIEELKKEAKNLLQDGDSSDVAKGVGMMKVIDELSNNYYPKWKSISWDILDFKSQAEQRWDIHLDDYPNAVCWQDVYDESKFEEALHRMIYKHDATIGITWDTIDFWLDEMCLKK